ncbi:MAG: mannosyltransferase [Actinomycetota bacterium]|nr:mannosyltransferase [Actinomycetota bacterium]
MGWWALPPLVLAVLGGWLFALHHSLWYDELYTAEVAPVALARLAGAVVHGEGTLPYLPSAPPSYNGPYYAVAHAWLAVTRLPADEVGLRLLSLVAAVAALLAFTRAVGRLAGPGVAAVAGLVAATNPLVVEFSVEARGYGLALLGTSLAALGLVRWLDGRPRSLLLYGLAGAAAGLMHWFAVLALLGFAVAALALRGRRAVPLLVVTGAACLPVAALVATAVANGVGASGAEWIADVGVAVPRLLLRSWSGANISLLVLTLGAAVAGLWPGGRRPEARLVAAAWFGVPLVVVTAVALIRPLYVDRYLLPALLGLAVLVALGATRQRRPVAAIAVAAVLAASVWATVATVRLGPKEDLRAAVDAVAAGHAPGQPVVPASRWEALGLDHYGRRRADLRRDVVLPPAGVPEASTVWVVRRGSGGVGDDRAARAALDSDLTSRGLRVVAEQRFPGRYSVVVVQRWERPALA